MTKILVVDDHDLVRMGLTRMLDDVPGFETVGEAQSGEEAIVQARSLQPDVVLMDVKMPGIGGLEATRRLHQASPGVKIIAVTAYDDNMHPTKLMQAGAMGYVTKGADFTEIVESIRKVVHGGLYMSNSIAQQLALKSFGGDNEEASPFEKLSHRELQTAMLIANARRVQDIADIFCVSPKTINSYRYRIFEKLGISSDVELTLLAVKHHFLDPETVV